MLVIVACCFGPQLSHPRCRWTSNTEESDPAVLLRTRTRRKASIMNRMKAIGPVHQTRRSLVFISKPIATKSRILLFGSPRFRISLNSPLTLSQRIADGRAAEHSSVSPSPSRPNEPLPTKVHAMSHKPHGSGTRSCRQKPKFPLTLMDIKGSLDRS